MDRAHHERAQREDSCRATWARAARAARPMPIATSAREAMAISTAASWPSGGPETDTTIWVEGGFTAAAARDANLATPANAMPAPPNMSGIPARAAVASRLQAVANAPTATIAAATKRTDTRPAVISTVPLASPPQQRQHDKADHDCDGDRLGRERVACEQKPAHGRSPQRAAIELNVSERTPVGGVRQAQEHECRTEPAELPPRSPAGPVERPVVRTREQDRAAGKTDEDDRRGKARREGRVDPGHAGAGHHQRRGTELAAGQQRDEDRAAD